MSESLASRLVGVLLDVMHAMVTGQFSQQFYWRAKGDKSAN